MTQSFMRAILALDGVRALYDSINDQLDGLGTLLTDELNR